MTVTGLLTAANLLVSGVFTLSPQTIGKVLFVGPSHVVTSTGEFGYSTSTNGGELTVPNILVSNTATATTICLVGDACRTTWPAGGAGTSGSLNDVMLVGNTSSLPFVINALTTSTFAGAISSTRFIAGSGVASNVAFGVGGQTLGLYGVGVGTLHFSIQGVSRANLTSGSLQLLSGTGLTVSADNTSDIGSNAARFNDGFFGGVVSSTSFSAATGLVGTPSYTFGNDSDSGIYQDSAGSSIDFALNGVRRAFVSTGGFNVNGGMSPTTDNTGDLGSLATRWNDGFFGGVVSSSQFTAGDGSSGAAGFAFTSQPGMGMYRAAANQMAFSIGGAVLTLSGSAAVFSNGIIPQPTTDNLYSLGLSTKRFSVGYFGALSVATTTISTALLPLVTNTVDIGSPSASWANIYASGTVSATGLFFTNATGTNATTTSLYSNNIGFINSYGSFINLAAGGNILTNGANSFATLTLSSGSGAITATAPIPTSTTIIANGFPMYTYEMNATSTNCIYWGPTYIRDAWDGSTMNPRLQWQSASGTGASLWALRAQSVASGTYIGAAFSAAKSYATGTTMQGFHVVDNTMTALTVGAATTGTTMKFELCREGGHAQDTLGASAYPDSVVIEYGLNTYSD